MTDTPKKSAFERTIYGDLPPEFYARGIDTVDQLARLHDVMPKPHQSLDLYMAYYRPAEAAAQSVKPNNKAAPAWHSFMRSLISRDEYLKANQITKGSMELSAAAAARLLATLTKTNVKVGQRTYSLEALEALDNALRNIENNNVPPELQQEIQNAGGLQNFLQAVEAQIQQATEAVAAQLEQIIKELMEYIDAKHEAEAAAAQLAGGHGYGLEGLSIWAFMENIDEFRKRVRLLSTAALSLRMFSRILPASLSHQMTESIWGGVDGVTQMQTYSQLPDVVPSELALMHASPTLFKLKLVQMSLTVYSRAAAIKPVIFVDKSGSMDEPLGQIPKISLATGLALAMYRRYGADIYLFDTEVDKVAPKEVTKTLIAVRADGGTAIDAVLDEVVRIGRRDHIYIIISDGITEASEEILREYVNKGLARQTRLILVPPSEDHYSWIEAIRRHGGRVIKAADVAAFIGAAKQALT
jgi:uncharacterized protein with von Willebrand factor type A (vWA) domain